MQALQETIRPSADLRNHYSEISKCCREKKRSGDHNRKRPGRYRFTWI